MDTPRKTKLYNEIAKDYTPKAAEMNICRYIQDLEAVLDARIRAIETAMTDPNANQTEVKRVTRRRKTAAVDVDVEADDADESEEEE